MLSRRQLLGRAGAVAGIAGGATLGATRLLGGSDRDRPLRSYPARTAGSAGKFRSRPDLRPPALAITGLRAGAGYVFLGPGTTDDFTKTPPPAGPQVGPLSV